MTLNDGQLKGFDPSEPRDERGRWTDVGGSAESGAGFEFFSPQTEHVNLAGAQSQLTGLRQTSLRQASSEIDHQLGMFAQDDNTIGAWKDGAENSLMTITSGSTATWDKLRVSGAMKGYLADQKQVLIFHDDPKSSAVLYNFDVKTGTFATHEQLLKDGLEFHTLIPHTDGSTTVYIADLDGSKHDAVAKAAEHFDTSVEYRFGRAEFIGSQQEGGTDREQRDDARRAYEEVIKQSPVQNVQGTWTRVHRRWGETLNPDNDSFLPEKNGDANDRLVSEAGETEVKDEEGNVHPPYLMDVTGTEGRENIIGFVTPDGTVLQADEAHENSARSAGTTLEDVLDEGGARVYLEPGDFVGIHMHKRPSSQQFAVFKRAVGRGGMNRAHVEDSGSHWTTVEPQQGRDHITQRDLLNAINKIFPVMPAQARSRERSFELALIASRDAMRAIKLSEDEIDDVFEEQTKAWEQEEEISEAFASGRAVLERMGLSF